MIYRQAAKNAKKTNPKGIRFQVVYPKSFGALLGVLGDLAVE